MTAAAVVCGSCGTELPPNSKFCNECGAAVSTATTPAEYKQVTVLFADVVRSMGIAAVLDMERLREIMTDLVQRCAAVVRRYGGGTVEFTGDGVMAVFGAPVALEDHAFRACLAASAIQEEAKRLAVEVQNRDGVALRLRVGLNSGRVIAGEIGSGSLGYAAIGEQVGMAQRMESVAPPSGVMLSESTAGLVEHLVMLAEPEWVRIKGAEEPVPVRRLLGIATGRPQNGRRESTLVGRQSELSALVVMLERSIAGQGCVVSVVGSPGIGKSRLVRELTTMAKCRGVDVFSTFCQSHASDIPFHVVADLLRAAFGVVALDDHTARVRIRARVPDADSEDLVLLDDLLGVADPAVALPDIDPDARRRRLTTVINAAAQARNAPAVFVVEDLHWIDGISEAMLADFLAVIPHTPSLVLITYRPEYHGALGHVPGAQTIALGPLGASPSSTLTAELLGSAPSIADIAAKITARAAGNPFFIEEIVRELAERGVLHGNLGNYLCHTDIGEVSVPATLQATIAARIDRLGPAAKRTLSAAAVIGARFYPDLLTGLGIDPEIDELIEAEMVDQVSFTRHTEYSFRHPLIRTVAYESQLISDRAELHRRLAATIEASDPGSADENAALIAEHLQAADDLPGAYAWHMRAGGWSTSRDIAAAQTSWRRARDVADRLPVDYPDRTRKRIAPRTLLCVSAWRTEATVVDTGLDELRELCSVAGDRMSLATGMAGRSQALLFQGRYRDAASVASDCITLVESIGDPISTAGQSVVASFVKFFAGSAAEGLRLAQRVIDLTDGDPTMGRKLLIGSPLALALASRGLNRFCVGRAGWKDDFDQAIAMSRGLDATCHTAAIMYKSFAIYNSALLPDATALRQTAEAQELAEHSGDDFALLATRLARSIILVNGHEPQHISRIDALAELREAFLKRRYAIGMIVPGFDVLIAKEKAKLGDSDSAIVIARTVIDELFESGEMLSRGPATSVLVESLLRRGADADVREAQAAIDRLAAVPTDPGFVLHELPLLRLRAMLAHALGDETGYCDYRDRYCAMARSLGFDGHMKWAGEMP
jgi:adenylate cyclase